jgi:hypothetical protein
MRGEGGGGRGRKGGEEGEKEAASGARNPIKTLSDASGLAFRAYTGLS